jgi:Ca2+-binding EF-hand superfamily protein
VVVVAAVLLLMKLAVGLALIVSIAVAMSQVLLYRRMASVESRIVSNPGSESVDRRLEALRLAVGALSSTAATNRPQVPEIRLSPAAANLSSVEAVRSPSPNKGQALQSVAREETGEEEEEPAPAAAPGPSAGGPVAPGPPAAPALERRKKLLEEIRSQLSHLDRNGDRKISLGEFKGDLSDFLYFDRDSNGSVTLNEMERVLAVEEKAADRVAAGDSDRDGALSPAEFKGSARNFRFIDENADGRIVPGELVSEHRRVNERFSGEDVNHDRKISPAEFSGGAARFEKYDKNQDGFLSRSELKDMLEHGH